MCAMAMTKSHNVELAPGKIVLLTNIDCRMEVDTNFHGFHHDDTVFLHENEKRLMATEGVIQPSDDVAGRSTDVNQRKQKKEEERGGDTHVE